MYERMLDRKKIPTEDEICEYIGKESAELLRIFDDALFARYDIVKDLKFPFGNEYGWGYRYAHKTKQLCYLFFEKDAFTILIQVNPDQDPMKFESMLALSLPRTKELWAQRYPCSVGGWLYYRVLNKEELDDVLMLLEFKKKPVK
ncbi:MAG: DUF3788 family protein [Eubacteriales bacterium]